MEVAVLTRFISEDSLDIGDREVEAREGSKDFRSSLRISNGNVNMLELFELSLKYARFLVF